MFVVSIVLAVICLICSIIMLAQKGPILVLHYALLTKEQKEEARVPKEYRLAALGYFLVALTWVLNALIVAFIPEWIFKASAIMIAITVLFVLVYNLRPQDSHYEVPEGVIPWDNVD